MKKVIMLLIWCSILCADDKNTLVIVVNQANKITNLSKYQVKMYYLAKKTTWEEGGEVYRMHYFRKTQEREVFSKTIFNKSSYRMQEYWIHVKEHGKPIRPPREARNARRVLSFVHRKKGAIAYVTLKDYNDVMKKKNYKIKIIKFEGMDTKSAKYPLKIK